MSAGKYNQRVVIEKLKDNPPIDDAHGEVDLTDERNWETHSRPWASINTKGGNEFWRVDKVEANVSHMLRLQYDRETRDINQQMRIKFRGRTLNIAAAYDIDEMHREIEIQATEPQ